MLCCNITQQFYGSSLRQNLNHSLSWSEIVTKLQLFAGLLKLEIQFHLYPPVNNIFCFFANTVQICENINAYIIDFGSK